LLPLVSRQRLFVVNAFVSVNISLLGQDFTQSCKVAMKTKMLLMRPAAENPLNFCCDAPFIVLIAIEQNAFFILLL
jgi:hypothetical protein